jgi:hypothetical protein
VAFDDLVEMARSRLARPSLRDPASEVQALGRALLTAYASAGRALVELWLRQPAFAIEAGPRPVASPVARIQAAGDHRVTNLRHEVANLAPLEARLLRLLDGTRDRAALLDALLQGVREGELNISRGEQPVTEVAEVRDILGAFIDECLPRLARWALLLA